MREQFHRATLLSSLASQLESHITRFSSSHPLGSGAENHLSDKEGKILHTECIWRTAFAGRSNIMKMCSLIQTSNCSDINQEVTQVSGKPQTHGVYPSIHQPSVYQYTLSGTYNITARCVSFSVLSVVNIFLPEISPFLLYLQQICV